MTFDLTAIAVEDEGQGAPTLFIHGLGGSGNVFQAMLGQISGRRVIRPDLPGAARSPHQDTALTIPTLAQSIIDLMGERGIARADIVGHSMGSLVCQHLAAMAPHLANTLTLLGPILQPPEPNREGLRARAVAARSKGLVDIAEATAQGGLAAHSKDSNPILVPFVRELIMRQDAEGFARHCEALASAEPAEHRKITCPVLLVTGTNDAVAPPSMAEAIAERCGNARVEILENCGHWTPIEHPLACAKAFMAFVASRGV